jgi:hypothetical protein
VKIAFKMDKQGAFAIFASVLERHKIKLNASAQQELIAAALDEASQGLSGKTTSGLSFHNQTRGKQSNIVLRYRLDTPEARNKMRGLSPTEIVETLRGYGVQWKSLCGAQVKEKVLELDFKSSVIESDIREHGEDITNVFGLDDTCRLLPPEHLVYVEGEKVGFNYDLTSYRNHYEQPDNIKPRAVFVKNGRVVFDFEKPEDANKVRRSPIYINNKRTYVK